MFDHPLFPFLLPFIAIVVAWAFVWKGIALWHAARRGDKEWFVVLLIINTAGILEILYLYIFDGLKEKKN